jgi:hypothetical protein
VSYRQGRPVGGKASSNLLRLSFCKHPASAARVPQRHHGAGEVQGFDLLLRSSIAYTDRSLRTPSVP